MAVDSLGVWFVEELKGGERHLRPLHINKIMRTFMTIVESLGGLSRNTDADEQVKCYVYYTLDNKEEIINLVERFGIIKDMEYTSKIAKSKIAIFSSRIQIEAMIRKLKMSGFPANIVSDIMSIS